MGRHDQSISTDLIEEMIDLIDFSNTSKEIDHEVKFRGLFNKKKRLISIRGGDFKRKYCIP